MVDVRIDQLADEIAKAIKEYTDDVSLGIAKKVEETAEQVLKEVKESAPRRIPEYYKHFKITSKDEYGKTKRVIWNKKHYRRVHLLEFGHQSRNGGRVDAQPHMRPAYEKYGLALPEHIKRIIRNGGGS